MFLTIGASIGAAAAEARQMLENSNTALLYLCFGAMVLDYISGSIAAAYGGAWSSKIAKQGIAHKFGEVLILCVAIGFDILIRTAQYSGVIRMETGYKALFFPLALIWYSITEALSIVENAVIMGAPMPPFIVKALKVAKERAEREAEQADGEKG